MSPASHSSPSPREQTNNLSIYISDQSTSGHSSRSSTALGPRTLISRCPSLARGLRSVTAISRHLTANSQHSSAKTQFWEWHIFTPKTKEKKLERHFIFQILKKSDLFCSFLQNTFWVLEKLMTLWKNIHRLSRLLPLQVWWRDVLRSAQWGAGCASHRDTRAVNDIMTFYFQQSMLWTWHYPLIVKSIHKHLQILRTEWQFCTVLYCTVLYSHDKQLSLVGGLNIHPIEHCLKSQSNFRDVSNFKLVQHYSSDIERLDWKRHSKCRNIWYY